MSSSVLNCPTCQAPVSVFDQYCGVCSSVLARLRWRTPDQEEWQSGDGHVAVRNGAKSARVLFRNEGVVPAGLVLQAEDLALLPDWVDREALGERILIVDGKDGELEIPLVADRLALLFEEQESSRPNSVERADLPFLTNLNELRDGRWTSRPFKLTLLAARPPRISPAGSFYRFLPIERLAGEGIEHKIEITNETIQTLELSAEISNDPNPEPSGYGRILAEAIVHRGSPDPQRIAPGDPPWTDTLRLKIPALPPEGLGWFSFWIEYLDKNARHRDRSPLRCLVQGRVGRGPTLKVKGSPLLWVTSADPEKIQQEHAFTLENPGHIPVAVVSLEVLRERDGEKRPAPERDWLSLSGLSSGDVVKPGESRTLSVRLHPSRRPSDEFEEENCERRIRIQHDGLPSADETIFELVVLASFGKAEEVLAGIDFGTTNSVVCISRNDQSYALHLEPNLDHHPDRIRSLMYFDSTLGNDEADERFLFGEEAYSSAAIRPENLVRSIKSVVAHDPRTKYIFRKRTPSLGDQPMTKTPQQLLNLFIAELRTRAESGMKYLPFEANHQPGEEGGTQLTLSRAVFSHPVKMPEETRRALMEAAHQAGINESVTDVNEFFEKNCIDEATAAVLAYVAGRVQVPPIFDVPLSDCERVLCFDMGGGTTDLAAVEVLNMAALTNGGTRVTVNLEAKDGAHFGGDDLDQELAFLILAEVRRQSEQREAPVLLEEILRAIRSRSYAAFRIDYQRRPRGIKKRTEDEALSLYKLATEILDRAEEAKRKLSDRQDGVTLVLPGTGWPREEEDSHAEATNFEVQLSQTAFEERVIALLSKNLPLLDSVVDGAGWQWPSVTTLLFTGQSARVPIIREEVARHVTERRGAGAPPLLRIDPGYGAFDPKNCVAIGAAIWGANRDRGSWLEIRNRIQKHLTLTLQTRIGPLFRPVKGLDKGKPFPVKGTIPVDKGTDNLKLYREGNRDVHAEFKFPPTQKRGAIKILLKGPNDYFVFVDGKERKGTVKS